MKKTPPLCCYTHLAFLLNSIIEQRPHDHLTFHEIHAAADEGRVLEFLKSKYGHLADFSLMYDSPFLNLEQMEAALADAASVFYQAEGKASLRFSGLSLAMAIVLEAIQQQFISSCRQPLEDADGPETPQPTDWTD